MTYQRVLGYTIPSGVRYTIGEGWSEQIEPSNDLEIGFDVSEFAHLFVGGATTKGKGVFCSVFCLYMMERYKFNFIDFNDQNFYENCCYSWSQENKTMLERLDDSFFLEPHGYPLEVLFPNGTQPIYPSFFKPYTIGFQDITAMDLAYFDKKAPENMNLSNALNDCEDFDTFKKTIKAFSPQAEGFFSYLAKTGVLSDETTIDFKTLNKNDRIHSFTTTNLPSQQHKQILSNIVLRLIQKSRQNRDCDPCLFYIREAPTLDQDFFRYFTTTVRHVNLNLVVDAQRRTKLIDPTAGQQFSSQALFQVGIEEGKGLFDDFGIPEKVRSPTYPYYTTNLLAGLSNADKGVALMNLVGSKPIFPFAVAPPVCYYRTKNEHGKYPNFIKTCQEHGEEMIGCEEDLS